MINNRAKVLLNFVIYSISSVHQEENYIFEYFNSIRIFAFTWLSVLNTIINSAELPKAVIMICNLLELEVFQSRTRYDCPNFLFSSHLLFQL